uniref:Uncharacterized protein n=1 Tax=Solanum lycopersicum TaxID=4081 RepID=A0A3Q7GSG3_SOLLC
MVEKLNYLIVTRTNISFPMSFANHQLLIKVYPSRIKTMSISLDIQTPFDRRSTSEYCVLVGGNLVSIKSKKQSVAALSGTEVEYRAILVETCELV